MRSMLCVALVGVLGIGCGSSDDDSTGSGGTSGSGGSSGGKGGSSASGGSSAKGGTSGSGGSSASGGTSGTTGGSGGSSGSSGTSGKGGTSGGGGSSASGGSAGSAGDPGAGGSSACAGTGATAGAGNASALPENCPAALDCIATKCDCEASCGVANDCAADCGCDQTCLEGCSAAAAECSTCVQNNQTCITQECAAEFLACLGGGGSESHTCAELEACCVTLGDQQKSICDQAAMSGVDTACSTAYDLLCAN